MTQTDHFAKTIAFAGAKSIAKWPIFKIVSFLEHLVLFRAVFCTYRTTVMLMWNSFCHVFRILNFHSNWPFCKGYRLCMGYRLCKIADFQNGHISQIFGVFSNGFFHRTLMFLYNGFWHVFGIFNFLPKLTIWKAFTLCMGYSLC